MPKKTAIILLCSVAIVLAAVVTVTHLMACNKMGSSGADGERIDPQLIRKYQARVKFNEIEVAGLKKRYTRNPEDGCVSKVEFYNDPANCEGNEDCPKDEKPGWIEAIEPRSLPKIWDELLVGAGSTQGESGSDVCVEWRFTVAGSPGWDCDYFNGHYRCSCIGFYYKPKDWCCQRTCKPRP